MHMHSVQNTFEESLAANAKSSSNVFRTYIYHLFIQPCTHVLAVRYGSSVNIDLGENEKYGIICN